MKLKVRFVNWHLGPLSLIVIGRIFLGVLAMVSLVVGGLMLVDLILYAVGSFAPLDVSVWGTYAAWAGAILPTLGVTVTAATWLAGRHAESLQAAEEAALHVIVEKRDGAVASLQNMSDWPLVVVSSFPSFSKHDARVVRPKSPRLLFSLDTESVVIRIRGCAFKLGIAGTLTRVGQETSL